MRISDWSSDVCSSDLALGDVGEPRLLRRVEPGDRKHPVDAQTVLVDELQPDLDRFERPVLAIGIHAKRDSGASAEPCQQESIGAGSQIPPDQPRPFGADQPGAADPDLGAVMNLPDAGGTLATNIHQNNVGKGRV